MAETNPQPRLIRMRDAPRYAGMDQHRFTGEIRPYLTEIPMGVQGIAFDRLEIDAWIDDYVQCNGRRPKLQRVEDDVCLNATKCPDLERRAKFGTSKKDANTPKAVGSVKAREKLAALRQKNS